MLPLIDMQRLVLVLLVAGTMLPAFAAPAANCAMGAAGDGPSPAAHAMHGMDRESHGMHGNAPAVPDCDCCEECAAACTGSAQGTVRGNAAAAPAASAGYRPPAALRTPDAPAVAVPLRPPIRSG